MGFFHQLIWHTIMSGVPGKSPFQQPISMNMLMRMNAKVLVTVIAFVAMGLATASAQITQEQLRTGSDEQLLREWTKEIAGDEFGGRKPMTPYEDKTVDYLARQLEELGLEPAFNGSWFQPFEMIAVTAKPVGGRLTVSGKKKSMLRYPDDLIIWTTRATKKVDLKNSAGTTTRASM